MEQTGGAGSSGSRPSAPAAWDRMAAWWDEKQGEDGDRWHRHLSDRSWRPG